jgi:hypothetical protein
VDGGPGGTATTGTGRNGEQSCGRRGCELGLTGHGPQYGEPFGPPRAGYESCMAELVSWFLIESGWTVVDRSGTEIGKVSAVIGDEDMDIFDGLHVKAGGEERYVPAKRVGPIEEGRVTIQATLEELEPTPAGDEPGGVEG